MHKTETASNYFVADFFLSQFPNIALMKLDFVCFFIYFGIY